MSFRQLSLFDAEVMAGAIAKNLMDGREQETMEPPEWVKEIIPEAEAVIPFGKNLCALVKRPPAKELPEGMEYCHWWLCGELYSGIFTGREQTA